jgi:hypothetical protein
MNLFSKIINKKVAKGKSFFDYPSGEKKKIIKYAAKESNRIQFELVRKYNKAYTFD